MFTDLRRTVQVQPIVTGALGAALLLSDDFVDRVISLQRKASAIISLTPVLGRAQNLPHVSLVQGQFSNGLDPQALLQAARGTLERQRQARLTLGSFFHQPRGWLFLDIAKSPWLQDLHNEVATLAAPFMQKPARIEESRVRDYTACEKESFARYGYRYMFEAFRPHLTLGRVNGELPPGLVQELDGMLAEFSIARSQAICAVSIYQMGENGAHAQTVMIERLSPLNN